MPVPNLKSFQSAYGDTFYFDETMRECLYGLLLARVRLSNDMQFYRTSDLANCHAVSGLGDGFLAPNLSFDPANLNEPHCTKGAQAKMRLPPGSRAHRRARSGPGIDRRG